MVGRTVRKRVLSLIMAMAMLLSMSLTAGAADSIDEAKNSLATVDITQVYNGTETDNGVHDYSSEGDDVSIQYEATLQMTEEMAIYLTAREKQLLDAKFNVHVDMDMDRLEFAESGNTITVEFSSTFLKPIDNGNFSSRLTSDSGGVFTYKITADKTWAQGQTNGLDIPMELIVFYDGDNAYNAQEVFEGIQNGTLSAYEDQSQLYGAFEVSDWTHQIKITLADMRVKDSVAETITANRNTWQTIYASGMVTGEFSYETAVTMTDIGDYGKIDLDNEYIEADGRPVKHMNTLEFGDAASDIEGWTSNEVSVELRRADDIIITPADITIYTGGDGYDGVVNGSGNEIGATNNGLPTPGFYITLPGAVNEWLLENAKPEDIVTNTAGDQVVDLSQYLTFTYDNEGVTRTWELQRYDNNDNDNNSMAYNQFIYRILPATDQDGNEVPIRLQFTDDDDTFMTSDDFAVNLDDLFHTYDMTIYAGDLNQQLVKANIKGLGEYTAEVDSGELVIRGVTDQNTTTTEVVKGDAPADEVNNITAQVPGGTQFYINDSKLEVANSDAVELLVDSIVPDENDTLQNSAIDEFDEITSSHNVQLNYLDLVDTSNGHAYVTTGGQEITLYWPYPAGTNQNTEFHIVHYDGLDRDDNSALDNSDYTMTLYSEENGNLENTSQGIKITVDSFSPFALFWRGSSSGGGGGSTDRPDPDDLNTEDHFAYIIGYPRDYQTGQPTDDESRWPVEPEGDITRAEVATIFFRMLTDDARDRNWSQTNDFTDVPETAWYNNAVSTLANMGILSGDPDGSFRPDDSITRAEFTKIAVSFFEVTGDYVDGTYSDVPANAWYADFIDAAVDLGLIEGYPDGTIRPQASITRAEACTIVNRTLGRVPDKDHLLPTSEMRVWPDNSDTNVWYYAQIQEATNSHDYEWIGEEGDQIENWTEKLADRDWAALEDEWSDANSAPGGEVMD